jgi:TatA/E family protein of Tat protein translocase
MGPLGWQETIFIFILALLLFGPKKLPELGRTIGKAMGEFRKASSELKSEWNRQMSEIERENLSLKEETNKIAGEISSSVHDASYYDYGAYGSDSYHDSHDHFSPSTVSAAAPQGAETPANVAASHAPLHPEGTIPVSQPGVEKPSSGPHA